MTGDTPAPEGSRHLATLRRFALRIGFGVVGSIAVVAVLLLLVFPTQQYLGQRDNIDDARETLAALRAETAALDEQVRSMDDPVVVERLAREQLSLTHPGEQLYRLNVDPRTALEWPAAWPLPGLKALLTGESAPRLTP